MVNTNENNAIKKLFCEKIKPCIDNTKLVVKVKSVKLVKRGQSEGETKWKGWA